MVVEEKLPQQVARLDRTGNRLFLMMAGEIGFLGDDHEMIMMVMITVTGMFNVHLVNVVVGEVWIYAAESHLATVKPALQAVA